MRSDDRSWPIRLMDLNKCYDSCNYLPEAMVFTCLELWFLLVLSFDFNLTGASIFICLQLWFLLVWSHAFYLSENSVFCVELWFLLSGAYIFYWSGTLTFTILELCMIFTYQLWFFFSLIWNLNFYFSGVLIYLWRVALYLSGALILTYLQLVWSLIFCLSVTWVLIFLSV